MSPPAKEAPAAETAAPASARIEVRNAGPARPWIGQLVPIEVDVIRPEGSEPPPPFGLDDVVAAGMIAKWSPHAAPPDERQVDGARFLVQHRTLLVFPQAEGKLTLPPIVARWTSPQSNKPVAAHSTPLSFEAADPQQSDGDLPLVASAVTLTQRFDRDLSGLRVGDGFTRTLTLRARDSDPVVFPELQVDAVAGLTAYLGAALPATNTDHGELTASQTLRITYVVDRVGPHAMRGASVRWLEPHAGRISSATIDDLTVWTSPNFSLGLHCFGTAHGTAIATLATSATLFILLAYAVVRRVRRGPGRIEARLVDRRRERRAFREVLRAGRHGASLSMLEKLYAWLALRAPDELDRTLSPLEHATPEAEALCQNLEQQLFREARGALPTSSFTRVLSRARRVLGRAGRPAALTSLNPTSLDQGEPSCRKD